MTGHKKQQDFFRQAVVGGLSHAYLFTGADGIGKKLFAKELARSLLCSGELFLPCSCSECTLVLSGMHPDLHIFEAKKDAKEEYGLNIKSVRQVAEISHTSSYSGKWKVIIIDDVHVLCQGSAEGANALLKSLEEPGKNTLFLLITSRPERVLPTIKSRCVTVEFEQLSDGELKEVLECLEPEKKWETVIRYASGSASNALMLAEINILDLVKFLDSKDKAGVAGILFSAGTKEMAKSLAQVLLSYFINIYKQNTDPSLMILIQRLKEFVRILEYNVNLNIQLLNLYVRLAGVL